MSFNNKHLCDHFMRLTQYFRKSDELELIELSMSECKNIKMCLDYHNLSTLKEIIKSIEMPNKLILKEESISFFNLQREDIAKHINGLKRFPYDDYLEVIKDAKLIEGKDYTEIEVKTFNLGKSIKGDISESYNKKSILVFSFNGLKNLAKYLHSVAVIKVPNYLHFACGAERYDTLDRALDFENIYRKTKEVHAKNRKSYLDELARVNGDTKLEDIKPEVKTTSVNNQKGMIIIRSTDTEYIISKNIEDKLESVMEDLDEFNITHFEEFSGKSCNSTIIVIESIDKKDILKAMKLYK